MWLFLCLIFGQFMRLTSSSKSLHIDIKMHKNVIIMEMDVCCHPRVLGQFKIIKFKWSSEIYSIRSKEVATCLNLEQHFINWKLQHLLSLGLLIRRAVACELWSNMSRIQLIVVKSVRVNLYEQPPKKIFGLDPKRGWTSVFEVSQQL